MRGLAHAKAQGRVGGRPSKLTPKNVADARRMRNEGRSFDHIAAVRPACRSYRRGGSSVVSLPRCLMPA